MRAREQADECLVWQFELEEYDVGFELLADGASLRPPARFRAASLGDDVPAETSLVDDPIKQQQTAYVEDALEPLALGSTYTFRWDNSYSLVRHKRLRYRFLTTSRRAFAAAQAAAREANARFAADRKKSRWADAALRPHVARELARQRSLQPHVAAKEQKEAIETLQQCVGDLVASFMTKPDSPLHEGSARAFVLALETVLRNGIKVGSWLPRVSGHECFTWADKLMRTNRSHTLTSGRRSRTTSSCWRQILCSETTRVS